MTLTRSEQLLDQARSDPKSVLRDAPRRLAELHAGDAKEEAITYRAMSLAARGASTLEASIEYADLAHKAALRASDDEQLWLSLLTKAGSHAIAGETKVALAIIDDALDKCEDPQLAARFRFQRGSILMVAGKLEQAREDLADVLPNFIEADDIRSQILVLENLGRTLLLLGEVDKAEEHLIAARDLAMDRQEWVTLAGIEQNLGRISANRGDIPEALSRLLHSDRLTMEYSGAEAPQHVSRAEVLVSVGRFSEALELSESIAEARHRLADMEHYPEALLTAARSALYANDPDRATELAGQAVASFEAQARDGYAAEAHRVQVEARYKSHGPSAGLLKEAVVLSDTLDSDGLVVEGTNARLLAGRLALDLNDTELAHRLLSPLADVRSGPLETLLGARLAAATLARADGDTRAALSAARAGLRTVANYQTAIGATDLRMGLEQHADELANVGLAIAIESRRPRRILEWMDRNRARSLLFRPVVPPSDDDLRALLGRLRFVESELREPQHRADTRLLRERRRLQNEIRDRDRRNRATTRSVAPFSVEGLIDELGDKTLVEMAELSGTLHAVVVRRKRATFHSLGSIENLQRELGHLRFALRRATRLGRQVDWGAVDEIDGRLFSGLGRIEGPVILSPPRSLMAVPWSVFPSLGRATLTVAPSAEIWWQRSGRLDMPSVAAAVAGPDLELADYEVQTISQIYTDALSVTESSVEEAMVAVGHADLVHFACHATFEHENPMFSSLRLNDGNLNIYDIERLTSVPDVVVLSACDSGYTEARSGEELAGLTSALLSMGTKSIVASVGLVPDSRATIELMVRLHQGVAQGREVPEALALAQSRGGGSDAERIAAASFVAVGA